MSTFGGAVASALMAVGGDVTEVACPLIAFCARD